MNTINIYGNVNIRTEPVKAEIKPQAEHFNRRLREMHGVIQSKGATAENLWVFRALIIDVSDHIRTLEGSPRSYEQIAKERVDAA
jgi:hypothetical protein